MLKIPSVPKKNAGKIKAKCVEMTSTEVLKAPMVTGRESIQTSVQITFEGVCLA
jgi:hypothetical protein